MNNQKSTWLSVAINIVIPAVILIKFSGDNYLGPVLGLVVALLFPLIYGLYTLITTRKPDFIAIVGLVGVLLTGGIGLLQLDPKWLAIKEASIPLLIAIALLVSEKTKYPLVSKLVNQVIDKEKVATALPPDAKTKYTRRLKVTTYIIASSFLLSALLNYSLARLLVKSQPGTEAFNTELGRMTALSYPIIVLPSLIILVIAIVYLLSGIDKIIDVDINKLLIKKK